MHKIAILTLFGSIAVGKLGFFQPFIVIGSIITLVGSGLICTLDVDSTSAESIGYQVIVGTGTGLVTQVPVIVAQAVSAREDIPSAVATVLCKSCFLLS